MLAPTSQKAALGPLHLRSQSVRRSRVVPSASYPNQACDYALSAISNLGPKERNDEQDDTHSCWINEQFIQETMIFDCSVK